MPRLYRSDPKIAIVGANERRPRQSRGEGETSGDTGPVNFNLFDEGL